MDVLKITAQNYRNHRAQYIFSLFFQAHSIIFMCLLYCISEANGILSNVAKKIITRSYETVSSDISRVQSDISRIYAKIYAFTFQ